MKTDIIEKIILTTFSYVDSDPIGSIWRNKNTNPFGSKSNVNPINPTNKGKKPKLAKKYITEIFAKLLSWIEFDDVDLGNAYTIIKETAKALRETLVNEYADQDLIDSLLVDYLNYVSHALKEDKILNVSDFRIEHQESNIVQIFR